MKAKKSKTIKKNKYIKKKPRAKGGKDYEHLPKTR
jgi:hypothetical protein